LSETLIVALGKRAYRVERPFGHWAKTAGSVSDVAVSSAGVHVLLREDPLAAAPRGPRVVTLDRDTGEPIAAWGAELIADSHMIAVAGDRLFIVDRDMHQIVVTSPQGEELFRLGERGRPLSPFNHPTDVAVAADGTIFVSDGYAGTSIHRFAADGSFELSWGGWGTGPGQFINPHAIWIMSDGRVVVADRENGRLQVFDRDGGLKAIWPGFYRPADIWGDADDNLYVVDGVPTLTHLDRDGNLVGRCRPVLNGAHGLWGDVQGRLYLAEVSPSRITRLVPLA
jgi:peptidylglycine monooxygenase